MYKVIIADDELFSRDFLEECINNLTEGFEVVKKFSSGTEVIEYLKQNDVDLVLTDIKMPEVSGLDIAKYVYESKPHIRVILVSGFQEFELARQAMKYNIKYYLVKVIDTDEFAEVMKNIKAELDEETDGEESVGSVEREMFLYDILCGMYEDEDVLREDYENLGLSVPFERASCEIINIEFNKLKEFIDKYWNYDFDIFRKSVSNLISIIFGKSFVMISRFDFNGCMLTVLCEKNAPMVQSQRIEYEFFDIFGIKINVTGRTKKSINEFAYPKNAVIPQEKKNLIALNDGYSTEDCVKKAIVYINDNYNKGISRVDVANHIRLNNVYFGAIFKKITGKTVSAYLLDLRMTKALELLKSGNKIEFICSSVGYKDIRNFRRIFRKYTGYTFDEYRKIYINK